MNTPHTSGISNNTMHGREKVHIRRGYEGLEGGVEVYLYSFFNLGAKWGGGWRPDTHCIGGWVGPTAALDSCGKSRPHRDSSLGPSNP